MRLISKYKNFILLSKVLTPCPLKILTFHRTKWKKTQKVLKYTSKNSFLLNVFKLRESFLKKKIIKNLNFRSMRVSKPSSLLVSKKKIFKKFKIKQKGFSNNLSVQVFFKRWFKLNKKYSENLRLKRITSQIFDSSIRNLFFKTELKKKKSNSLNKQFCKILIKPLFKINILLTKLFFFTSVYEANKVLQNKKVLLNGSLVRQPNVFLKKGDLITFSEFSFKKLIHTLNSSSFFSFFYNFVEIDHYSKTIILLKDYDSLSNEDINLIYKKYLNIKYFINYFK
jgi:ribosomal protein S4